MTTYSLRDKTRRQGDKETGSFSGHCRPRIFTLPPPSTCLLVLIHVVRRSRLSGMTLCPAKRARNA